MQLPGPERQRPIRLVAASLALVLAVITVACGEMGTAPAGSDTMGDTTMPVDTTPNPDDQGLTDRDILALAQYDDGWTWWEHSSQLLDRAGNSPHGDRIRVRYNLRAATQLDSTGRVRSDADFPDSSAVVKQVYRDGMHVSTLVMFKAEGDPHAGHGAWLWGEYRAGTGEALHSIADDNGACHNCHVGGIDHMRMNDVH